MRRKIQHIANKIKQTERTGLLLAGALLLLVIAGRWYKQELPVRKIKLSITNTRLKERLISKKDIARVLVSIQHEGITKLKVKDIDFRGLEQGLEQHPSIREAEVYLDMTNILHIDVQQRIPIARIIDNNGTQYYMDTEGYRVPLSQHCSYRVPVVTGIIPVSNSHNGEKLEDKSFVQLYEVLMALRKDKILSALIEQLSLDVHDDLTLVPKAGYKRIFFGKIEEVQKKLQKLKDFYKKGDWGKYEMINLEYDNLVFAKKKIKTT